MRGMSVMCLGGMIEMIVELVKIKGLSKSLRSIYGFINW